MDIGNELIARSGELGELLAREEGKTRAEGVGEVSFGPVLPLFRGGGSSPDR